MSLLNNSLHVYPVSENSTKAAKSGRQFWKPFPESTLLILFGHHYSSPFQMQTFLLYLSNTRLGATHQLTESNAHCEDWIWSSVCEKNCETHSNVSWLAPSWAFLKRREHCQRQLGTVQRTVALNTLMPSVAPVKPMQLLVICSCSFLKINTEEKKSCGLYKQPVLVTKDAVKYC